jgi:hypothetical protein
VGSHLLHIAIPDSGIHSTRLGVGLPSPESAGFSLALVFLLSPATASRRARAAEGGQRRSGHVGGAHICCKPRRPRLPHFSSRHAQHSSLLPFSSFFPSRTQSHFHPRCTQFISLPAPQPSPSKTNPKVQPSSTVMGTEDLDRHYRRPPELIPLSISYLPLHHHEDGHQVCRADSTSGVHHHRGRCRERGRPAARARERARWRTTLRPSTLVILHFLL